jgi:hypothetical protein
MNYHNHTLDKEVSPEPTGLGYGWVCAVLEVSPCQYRQYTNAEATWAYAGCKFVAFTEQRRQKRPMVVPSMDITTSQVPRTRVGIHLTPQ